MKKVRYIVIGLIIGLIAGIAVGYGISASSAPKTAQTASNPPTIAQLLALVNAERAKNGVAPLKEDARLDASAQMKANDEVAYNYFGHISPPASPNAGRQGYLYINDTGITCVTDSENLTENNPGSDTSEQAVYSWIQSPPHHKAMIDPRYTLTGFGINGNEIVEHFCQQ